MAIDASYKEQNRASTERIRTLIARLSDEEMQTKVGEHWTIVITLVHLAFWDKRVMHILDVTEREGKLFDLEIDVVINDLSLQLWEAIPPHEASRICIETSEALDKRLEDFPPQLLEELYDHNKRWVVRALHRNEHMNDADAALKTAA